MALEDLTGSSKFISDLVETNPTVAVDKKFEGDDHIRGVKNVLKNTFPNVTGAVNLTQGEFNILDGATVVTADLNLIAGFAAVGGQVMSADNDASTHGVFYQSVAPYGWTIDVAVTDRMLVVDASNGGTTGGSGNITGGLTTGAGSAHTHTFSDTATTNDGSNAQMGNVLEGAFVVSLAAHTHNVTVSGDTGEESAHTHALAAPAWAKTIVCSLDTL